MSFDIKFKIKSCDQQTYARRGCLRISINGHKRKIETPTLWFGDLFFNSIGLWDYMNISTIMFNAYEILSVLNKKSKIKSNNLDRISEKFDEIRKKASIMIDSGGYLFQKDRRISIRSERLIKLYSELKPEIGVVLDHPFNPLVPEKENTKRWERTLRNTIKMWKSADIAIIPVIHGYSKDALINACRQLKELLDPQIVLVGLGSLVPLIRYTKGIRKIFSNSKNGYSSSLYFVAEAVRIVRVEFPDSFLHVFGIGSVSTMHFLFSLGVDSVDTMGWRLKAAHGAIQLPGVGDRFVTAKSKKRVNLSDHDKEILEKCKCPVCKGLSLEERLRNLDNAIKNGTFKKRAIHNAWVFNWELTMARRMIGRGRYLDYILTNISNRAYKKVIEHFFFVGDNLQES
jgi:queuine/archaeosine tRNA-ribosyltransferase